MGADTVCGDGSMESLWRQTSQFPTFPTLDGDKKTDVLIVGGGMAGLLCAWMLEQDGVDYLLVEAGRIGQGVTENTTAKITVQHGLIYDSLVRRFGVERAKRWLTQNGSNLYQWF